MSASEGGSQMQSEDGPALSGPLSMMSGPPHSGVSGGGAQSGSVAPTQSLGGDSMMTGPAGSAMSGPNSMMTPQVPHGNAENINAMQTPLQTPSMAVLGARAGGSKSAGYFTPRVNATPMSSNAVSATPGRAVTGRRELGAGALHLWNLHETPNSVAAARTASASIMTADDDGEDHVTTMVWGTEINVRDVRRQFTQFIQGYREKLGTNEHGTPILADAPKYMAYLRDIVSKDEDNFSLDCQELNSFEPQLYRNLCLYPREVIPIIDDVINSLVPDVREDGDGSQPAAQNDLQPPAIRVRPYNLCEERALRDLDPNDIEALVQVEGLVTRCSNVIPDMRVAKFVCEACGVPVWVGNEGGRVTEPDKCPNQFCGRKQCTKIVHNQCLYSDKQLVKLQESPNLIPEGETPHAVTAYVYDALVDYVRPGDRVKIVGMYKALPVRANPRLTMVKSVLRTYIDVLHIDLQQQDIQFRATGELDLDDTASQAASETGSLDMELENSQDPFGLANLRRQNLQTTEDRLVALGRRADIYDLLTASLAPSIYEMDDVKKGILCQLFGAVHKEGLKARNMINILLVGDPGVSKSQLLTYVHKVAPRGLYTSGRGSSAVGLTAYVTKDPETKEHVLESGALVLSDQGICCIDEFDKMSDAARAMLHEVMEQQTVSVAKAGIIATLNARTSVLAAANPRTSRYNPRASIVENINLPPSLLSRFDLVYLLLDRADTNSDQRLARHLTSLFWEEPPEHVKCSISLEEFKEYVAFCRNKVNPRLSDAAVMLLAQGYLDMRMLGQDQTGNMNRNVISATPRQLESLIRLSEALARMELQEEVLDRHVQEALRLMKVSMMQSAMDQRTGMIDLDRIYSGVGALDREMRKHLAVVLAEILTSTNREMSVMELTNAVNEAAGPGGVKAQHALVQKVLASMEGIVYDSARGRAKTANA